MPAAVLGADPLELESVGSSNLANASIDDYGADPVWRIVPLGSLAAFTEVLPPAPPSTPAIALLVPAHGHAVFGKIHVIPRKKDLGHVGSLQEFSVEVWNAFLERSQVLDTITVAGVGNLTVVDHLGQPAHFPATASELYTIRVKGEGDPVIDSVVTWIFIGLPSEGVTDLIVTGFRMIPFGFEPNRAQDIVESFGYLTDVIESFDGSEQRVKLRATPVGKVAFSVLLDRLQDVQEANAILFGNQSRPFGVPRWQFSVPLTAPASAGDLELLCSTTSIPFEVGGLCLVWSDSRTLEAHTIAQVLADRLVLSFPLERSWPAGACVIPLVIGRLSPEEVFAWESLAIGSQDLAFSIDRFRP